MGFAKADPGTRELLDQLVAAVDGAEVKKMFGNAAGFVGGNMFAGIFGKQLFVRLPEEERDELLAIKGASRFDPMGGRPMKEYVVLPAAWHVDLPKLASWFDRSATWTRTLPPKKKPKKPRKPKKTKRREPRTSG